jgi:ATP-dependent RNA helicase DeaD
MSDEWWGVEPAVTGTLEAWGWSVDRDAVRQVLPAVARHGNAVVTVPPAPAHAAPALAGVVAAVASSKGRALILAAPAMVPAVGRLIGRLADGTGLRVVTATGPARAARHLAEGTLDLLVAAPATALALHSRSSLAIDGFTSLTLAWPDDWDADEAVTLLLGDLPRDAQRVILTGDPTRITDLVERHARRALVVPPPAEASTESHPPLSIRTVPAGWTGRHETVTALLELLDPTAVSIWSADGADLSLVRPILAECPALELVTGNNQPTTPLVICLDIPSGRTLARLGAGRDVVLLVPPGTEPHVHRLVPTARPIRLSGLADRLRDRDAVLRTEIEAMIGRDQLGAASYAIAPLFDRHDPQAVAAACFALWRRGGAADHAAGSAGDAATMVSPAEAQTPVGGVATARLWVGVGRRDEAAVGDLVAVLVKEVGMARESIGRIELRETFALVEVPAGEADRIAQQLSGLTVRRRKLVARVDRGLPGRSGGGRSGGPPRGGGGGTRPPRR